MSGNRNQSHAKPDGGAPCESSAYACHRETTVTAPVLDSTQSPSMSEMACLQRLETIRRWYTPAVIFGGQT